jgi:hypothetical protein
VDRKEIRYALIEHYRNLLEKNRDFMNGDDEKEPTTEELRIIRPLGVILRDLEA